MQAEILAIFRKISKIPRKSGNEAQISKFLFEEIKALNLEVVQDAWGNIIAEKPASPGRAKDPVVILQAHMDMVCVAAEGVAYNPLQDEIKVKEADGYLTAEGTSLGADDGIGVAAIFYLLQAKFSHGPLRAIFTVDEENGMSGAKNLDEAYLQADYLINCDSEDYDMVTVSSAGSVNIDFSQQVEHKAAQNEAALLIHLKGLSGGHSGMDINAGRANAIKLMGVFLDKAAVAGLAFELADIFGGTARNSIPDYAKASVCIAKKDSGLLEQVRLEMNAYIKSVYGAKEPLAEFAVAEIDQPKQVMDCTAKENIIKLITLLHTGVYAMSKAAPNLVETSANIGMLETNGPKVVLKFFPRSALNEKLEEFKVIGRTIASVTGFDVAFSAQSPAWPENALGKLAGIVSEAFAKITGQPMRRDSIHAGLECSFFYQKNQHLDMVSIGPTVLDVHSPSERLKLDTLAIHVDTIKAALCRLK